MRVRSKYGAKRTTLDGVTFASKAEARRYEELKLRQMAGEIADLELQPDFPLIVLEAYRNGPIEMRTVGKYVADFMYVVQATGEIVVEDVKSPATRTPVFRLKKKLVEAIHGITVQEVF